jgi:protein MPE1
VNETIPQLQGQVQQLSVMLQNTSLPAHVRQSTMHQFQQTQMELQQAQTFAALAADISAAAAAAQQQQQQGGAPVNINMGEQMQNMNMNMNFHQPQNPSWVPQAAQLQAGLDSAYQRLPVNNRRRNNKRERPSDFLEIGTGEQLHSKMPKFWE